MKPHEIKCYFDKLDAAICCLQDSSDAQTTLLEQILECIGANCEDCVEEATEPGERADLSVTSSKRFVEAIEINGEEAAFAAPVDMQAETAAADLKSAVDQVLAKRSIEFTETEVTANATSWQLTVKQTTAALAVKVADSAAGEGQATVQLAKTAQTKRETSVLDQTVVAEVKRG
jgi:hypothetical protein